MGRTATPAEGVVAIGASAGAVEALTELAAGMPPNFPFAVLIVIHMSRGAPWVLPQIVDRSGPLPAVAAVDGAVLEAEELEEAVWAAIRIATEKARLARELAESAHGAVDLERYSASADQAQHAIAVLGQGLRTPNIAGSGRTERVSDGR